MRNTQLNHKKKNMIGNDCDVAADPCYQNFSWTAHFFVQLIVPLLERLINMQCFAGRTVPRIQLKGSTHKGHCCCASGERFDCLMHKLFTYLLGLSESIVYSSGVSRRSATRITGVQTFGPRFLFPIIACCTVKRCCEFLKLIAAHTMHLI